VDQAKKLVPVFDESERSPETSLMGKKGEEIVPDPKPTKLRGSDERKIVIQGAAAGFSRSTGRRLVGKSEGLCEEEDDWDIVPDPKPTKLRGSDERKIVIQRDAAGFSRSTGRRLVGKSEGLYEEEDDWDTVPDPKATKLRASDERKRVAQGSTTGFSSGRLLAGVGAGAGIGALVGSIVPGPGTLIGAAVGATIGGIIQRKRMQIQRVHYKNNKKPASSSKKYDIVESAKRPYSYRNYAAYETLSQTEMECEDLLYTSMDAMANEKPLDLIRSEMEVERDHERMHASKEDQTMGKSTILYH
jgi:hypothetical protein